MATEPAKGPVETAVAADIATLGELESGATASLAQIALTLARKLDSGAGLATAAVSHELRESLGQLWEAAGADDDNGALFADLGTPVPGLPSEVRYPASP